ncbi:MAG: EpsD family peptidyl-prolyl cis-trans isomerase [Thiobacillus sp.]
MLVRHVQLLVAVGATLALTACEPPTTASGEAIAATVGGEVISEGELNRAVSRLGKLGEANATQVRSQVLEALIDQRLVSQAAIAARLDKNPAVILAMQQAQRKVLAEAYMEGLFKEAAQPSDNEISHYYGQHPELFSARKIYRVQELELELAASRLPEVEARLKQSPILGDLVEWLKEEGIEGRVVQALRPAEQLSAAILAQLLAMEAGQVRVWSTGPERINILQLQGTQRQPVTLDQAKPAIKLVLQAEKRKAALEAEVKKLRSSGTIDYASGFAPGANHPNAAKQLDVPAARPEKE